jgi:transposase-like protein
MNLITIHKKYGTQAKCLSYLEKLRWGKTVRCTKCHSDNTVRIKTQAGRHHCNNCKTTFSVLVDTIFENTRLELPQWFIIIGLMLNAKKGIAAKQIQRDTGVTYKTAWYTAMRIRCGMIDNCKVLQNIVEMDEAYVGGKPRKKPPISANIPSISNVANKRGRGTRKTPVVGIVERDGDIVLKVIEKLTFRNLFAMLKKNVKTDNAILITDEYTGYKRMDNEIEHLVINHKKEYSRGAINTNTIEGFWAIVKNSIRGQYIALSKKYLPFYLVQAAYIYNLRNDKGNLFEQFLINAVMHDNQMEHYKPIKNVKDIVYKKCVNLKKTI